MDFQEFELTINTSSYTKPASPMIHYVGLAFRIASCWAASTILKLMLPFPSGPACCLPGFLRRRSPPLALHTRRPNLSRKEGPIYAGPPSLRPTLLPSIMRLENKQLLAIPSVSPSPALLVSWSSRLAAHTRIIHVLQGVSLESGGRTSTVSGPGSSTAVSMRVAPCCGD